MSHPHNVVIDSRSDINYDIRFEPFHGRVKALFNGKVVADSEAAMVLYEGNLSPVIYFPPVDVRLDLLRPSEHVTYCPFRGNPTYYNLLVDGQQAENAVWQYRSPYPEADYVKDYIAFHKEQLDDLNEERKEDVLPPSTQRENPLVDWLIQVAWQSQSIEDLVTRWIEQLQHCDAALIRFALVIRTLHPQLMGSSYRWQVGDDAVVTNRVEHEVLSSDQYRNSPFMPIFDGAGGVRRRITNQSCEEFPVLKDIQEMGGTDYVAMPIVFSDGQINAITMATDRQGGFATEALVRINEALPVFSRLVEVFAQREKSESLLSTYLGTQSGHRVLNGLIKRGDGTDIHAVIWFCDLRGSSTHAANMSRDAFLRYLNDFFDLVVGAVLDHGGEVLRFIGDAALAIFAFETGDENSRVSACKRALHAAKDAAERVARFNTQNRDDQRSLIEFGIGLHIGDVTYGNIGTQSRLEFTVIGAAANEAARIESLCKELGEQVLVSEEFARFCPVKYRDMGCFELRGTERELGIYTPVWDEGGEILADEKG